MKKLGTVIYYECATSFKYIWIFYAIVLGVVTAISALVFIITGTTENAGTNALEVNSMVYAGILGALGFKEDFKMLIQNGFTRKYIFLATASLFAFISGILALMDTIIGKVILLIFKNYSTVFSGIYGRGHSLFINWLWLFLVYMLICCLVYLIVLIINKIGKTASIAAGAILGVAAAAAVPFLFRFLLPDSLTDTLIDYLIKGAGFMADGSINFIYPFLILFCSIGILSFFASQVIQKTELKI